ncbi:hypothetical protein NDU88_005882 [Pleurodeles waltl]|uniref:Uncharacterized protein n=1 Tax=Pleurodeles waltl TaxID=8319 RepID=A0AAV7UL84_PLEWA|nr:hypothetical protein NDU88_005882 [Pleurodeles waltl]
MRQGHKAEAAAQFPTRAAENKLSPGRAPTSVLAGGSSRATDSVYAACRSLSARRCLNAGRVTHCAARLLLGRSARLPAPRGSRHSASRSSGVPPPRSVGTCLSGVCRRLVLTMTLPNGPCPLGNINPILIADMEPDRRWATPIPAGALPTMSDPDLYSYELGYS